MSTLASNAEDRRFTLVIDAGHGGNDTGALGAISKEKDINLNVALAFGRYVERNCPDVKIVYTRKTDVFIPLMERANIANRNKADLFISIHCNAAGGEAAGTETLVYSIDGGPATQLANCIQSQIVNSLGTIDRGLKERPGLVVLKHTDMPAVLVETAFIDNANDSQLLTDRQDDFARAIARGVTDYASQRG